MPLERSTTEVPAGSREENLSSTRTHRPVTEPVDVLPLLFLVLDVLSSADWFWGVPVRFFALCGGSKGASEDLSGSTCWTAELLLLLVLLVLKRSDSRSAAGLQNVRLVYSWNPAAPPAGRTPPPVSMETRWTQTRTADELQMFKLRV